MKLKLVLALVCLSVVLVACGKEKEVNDSGKAPAPQYVMVPAKGSGK